MVPGLMFYESANRSLHQLAAGFCCACNKMLRKDLDCMYHHTKEDAPQAGIYRYPNFWSDYEDTRRGI